MAKVRRLIINLLSNQQWESYLADSMEESFGSGALGAALYLLVLYSLYLLTGIV